MACITPTLIKNPDKLSGERFITVPCGQCPACRKQRAQQWTFRLRKELEHSYFAHFITLTYDEENVPYGDGHMSLCTRDLQLFWKRLRKLHDRRYVTDIRYYAVGEYGGRTARPHYHAIVFDCWCDRLYSDAWPHGNVHVGKVTNSSIAYVTGYVMKPSVVKELENDSKIERTRPFMSKGLGEAYITPAIREWHNATDDRGYVVGPGGEKSPMPRYYRYKLFSDYKRRKMGKKASAEHMKRATEIMRKWKRDNPGKDYDRAAWIAIAEEIRLDAWRNKSKRNKV